MAIFAGPKFFHHGLLLNLVAQLYQLKIGGIEAGRELMGVFARNCLVQQRELAARPKLNYVGRKQVAQKLMLEERVDDLKRFCGRYFHSRAQVKRKVGPESEYRRVVEMT